MEIIPMSNSQFAAVMQARKGEEKQYFDEVLVRLQETFDTMPRTYEQDGKGDEAVAYLHYFGGGSDWWILERDSEPEQLQAFGFACLNGDTENAELGYINLKEITASRKGVHPLNPLALGAELDFHFEPTTLGEIKKKLGLAA